MAVTNGAASAPDDPNRHSGMERTPLVVAIVLNWNGAALTIAALASLRGQRYRNLRSIVVDNGSDEQATEITRITTAAPDCAMIASPANLGFAGGCNLGIRAALDVGADYALLLNNDAELDPNAIGRLVQALERSPRAGAAAPLIYLTAEPDRLWWGGGTLTGGSRVLPLPRSAGECRHFDSDLDGEPTDWLTATALLVRRDAIERAGLLDPVYFLYWEDVDWSIRMRHAGFELLVVRGARAWHHVNASTSRLSGSAVYYWERNRLRFVERWGSRWSRTVNWAKVGTRLLAWRIRPPRDDPDAHLKLAAYADYARRRFGEWSRSA